MLRLCELFHCPPSVLYEQDASVLRLVKVAAAGGYFDRDGGEEWPT